MGKNVLLILVVISIASLLIGAVSLTGEAYQNAKQSISDLGSSLSGLEAKKRELSQRDYGMFGGFMGMMMNSSYSSTASSVNGLQSELRNYVKSVETRANICFVIAGISAAAALIFYRKRVAS